MTQKIRLELNLAGEQISSTGLGTPSTLRQKVAHLFEFPDGTGAGESAAMWGDERSLAGGAIDSLELDNLPSVSVLGPVSLSKVKGIAVLNDSASGNLTLGGGAGGSAAPSADAWSDADAGVEGSPFGADADIIALGAGDLFVWTAKAGVDVVAASAESLGIEAHSATQSYKILVWGDV